MPVRKNFLYEVHMGCYSCPFREECRKMWQKETGQSGWHTYKEADKDNNCPEEFEQKFSYSDIQFKNLESGGKVLLKDDMDNIEVCRPEIRFWKELNQWSVKFYYSDDGGYDITWTRIFFDSKKDIISWLTGLEE